MNNTFQTESQSIIQHHLSVWHHMYQLINNDTCNFKIPAWFTNYKNKMYSNLHDFKTIKHYCLFHDVGKSECISFDENGKKHFLDHANISADIFYNNIRKDDTIMRLIRHDMAFHTLKFEEILKLKLSTKDICTLLLSSLAELHSNAKMFGGIDSTSFKIKWKRLDKLGKKILYHIFDHPYVYVITRKDLSIPQQTVQSIHASIESAKLFCNKLNVHPSVIVCTVKNENKLNDAIKYLHANKIRFCTFREPDIGDKLTAIATEPLFGEDRKIMNKFQLMRG